MNRRNFIRKTAVSASLLGALPLSGSLRENTKIPKMGGFSRYEDEGQTMKIAVVQQDGNPGQVEINRSKALAFAREALAQKADVILFHEELLIGYDKNLRELAEPVDGETTRAFQ